MADRLLDQSARRRAATDFDTNLVVLAGAGTGKTSLLVERMLSAIGADRVSLDQLAAMTFTEKAAGEMRERLALGLERLHALAGGGRAAENDEAGRAWRDLTERLGIPAALLARRAAAALEQLDRATVETIHGFCSKLLRSHPVAAGVDPGFRVDAGEHAEVVRRDLWGRFLAEQLGPGAPRVPLWTELLGRVSIDEVRRTAFALCAFGIPPALLRPPFDAPSARRLLGREAAALIERIDSMLTRQTGLTGTALGIFASMRRCLVRFRDEGLPGLRAAIEAEPAFEKRLVGGSTLPGTQNVEGVAQHEVKQLFQSARSFVRKLLAIDEDAMRLLLEAAAPFALAFRESYLRQGFVSFDGLLVLARDLLRDHPRIRSRLKRRYRMLLVDEFQDTDPLQYEIVLFLAESVEDEAADAFAAKLEPGGLFIVGDAKQSIYRFRGADYAAYRRAVERVVAAGGERLALSSNFRSVPEVVEPVNRLFEDAETGCWIDSPYQPDYAPIEAARPAAGSPPRTEIWTVELDEGVAAHERRDAEGHLIAAEIERLVREERACRYGQITLLFRAFTQLTHYLRPLRQRDIPFVVDGGREFLERPEVGHLMAAVHTLVQPADQPALLAFLRSPAGAVSDRELAAYAAAGGRWDWRAAIDADEFPLIADRFARLGELAREIRDLPADAVVRRVLDRTLLLPLGGAAFEGPQRVANLRKLASAAGDLARDGRLSLEEVLEALQEGRMTDIESDAPLADDAVNAVRITSIHRMKGLENDWIFLPDLARGEARGMRQDVLVRAVRPDADSWLALRVGDKSNAAAAWFERENERHESAEEVRVFYVALTRARERLVVVAGPSRNRARWLDALAPWGYDVKQPPADDTRIDEGRVLHRVMVPRPTTRQRSHTLSSTTLEARTRYDAAMERMRVAAEDPPLVSPSRLGEQIDRLEAARGGAEAARDVGRAVGIVMHRLLQRWDGATREETLARVRQLSVETAEAERIAVKPVEDEACSIAETFLGSELVGKLGEIEVLGRELPVLSRWEAGRVLRGSIDLLYRDAEGTVVVADYKTDRETDAQRLREVYARQLRGYAAAVQQALGLVNLPRMELWSLRAGTIVRLTGRCEERRP